ncbi:helix-turn-helix transcriptional regulator [Nocardia sp. NPDC024068]|uniref:helix-turn-helix domain-containing protein n=1 Tax=Nocardia sp. NPDC024068 TaxID=3157197 RepID=UPI003404596B
MGMSPRPDDGIGLRIRLHRERLGRTQVVIAGLSGISADYLGQIERGRKTPSASVASAIAVALGVPVGSLFGDEVRSEIGSEGARGEHLASALITRAGDPKPVDELARRIDNAWAIWLNDRERYSRLLPLLPGLIQDTEAARRSFCYQRERRRISGLASDLYALLRTVTRRIGRSDLSFLVADRALRAAEDADDPIRMAVANWNIGHTLLLVEEYDAAVDLVETVSKRADFESATAATAVAMTGALQLVAAVAESRNGRTWRARDRLNRASACAARSKGVRPTGHTMFGSVNVELHALSIELEAGESTEALRMADRVDIGRCHSVERRFTLSLDLARAYALRREEAGTLLHLIEAERTAPEDFAHDSRARDMVRGLVRSSRRDTRTHAATLAARADISC